MSTQVVVSNVNYSPTFSLTTVTSQDGPIATFPYNPSDTASVIRRYLDFAEFSVTRDVEVVDVIGDVVPVQGGGNA